MTVQEKVIVYIAPPMSLSFVDEDGVNDALDLSKPMRLIAERDYAKLAQEAATLRAERDAAVQDATRQLDLRFAANRELVALQRETDALKTFVSVSGRWVRKYGTYNAVPTPEALEDFGKLMQAYNALEVQP